MKERQYYQPDDEVIILIDPLVEVGRIEHSS